MQHTYSCLYGTFLANNPSEREKRNIYKRTCSVWALLRAGNKNFHNFLYTPGSDMVRLSPFPARSPIGRGKERRGGKGGRRGNERGREERRGGSESVRSVEPNVQERKTNEGSHRTLTLGCFPRSCIQCVMSGPCTSGQLFICLHHLHAHLERKIWIFTFPQWLRARNFLAVLWTGEK